MTNDIWALIIIVGTGLGFLGGFVVGIFARRIEYLKNMEDLIKRLLT